MFVIILVAPQMGENIGFVARVMSNFGFEELRLVAPRDEWPNDIAQSVAAKGSHIIHNTKIYSDVAGAVADCNKVIATAAHIRNVSKTVYNIADIGFVLEEAVNSNGKIGIMFGRESSGLSNEEMALADYLFTIPTSAVNSSMNLSHAVCVVLYEIIRAGLCSFQYHENDRQMEEQIMMDKADVTQLVGELEHMLDETNFFQTSTKKPRMMLHITNTFTKANWTKQEFRTMYGIIKRIYNCKKQ